MKVKIKTWNTMKKEFNYIKEIELISLSDNVYTRDMEINMSEDRIIEVEPCESSMYKWSLTDENGYCGYYTITDDMIEEIL